MLSLPRNSEGWWLLVWMILFPTIGAFWAWNQASGVLALPIQNISQYLIPVSAVVMAHFMLSEPLSAFQILGIFLINLRCGNGPRNFRPAEKTVRALSASCAFRQEVNPCRNTG